MAEPALRKVAWARNQAEAELIQGLLRERGIPSIEKRERGFDVPDFLAAGPRAILVPHASFDAARELLGDPPAVADGDPGEGEASHWEGEASAGRRAPLLRLTAGVVIVVLLVGFLATTLFFLVD